MVLTVIRRGTEGTVSSPS